MTAVRRGEAAVLARYEGAYAATTLTVMGDRTGFVWSDPPTWGRDRRPGGQEWQRMKIQPSDLCDRRRIRPPRLSRPDRPAAHGRTKCGQFLADTRDTRVKRDELIDRLVGSKEYVDYWTNKWADLLQVNRKFLGPEGATAFRQWIRDNVAKNTPYDKFVYSILTASGSNRENPGRVVLTRFCASRRRRWRTRRTCSWACGSIATSATTIPSSAGRRTSTIRRPPTSPRSA